MSQAALAGPGGSPCGSTQRLTSRALGLDRARDDRRLIAQFHRRPDRVRVARGDVSPAASAALSVSTSTSASSPQHSTTLTARPPSEVSLYLSTGRCDGDPGDSAFRVRRFHGLRAQVFRRGHSCSYGSSRSYRIQSLRSQRDT